MDWTGMCIEKVGQIVVKDKQTDEIIVEWKLEENDWNWEKIKEQNYYNKKQSE